MFTNEYLKRVYADVERRDGHEPEFLQAVREVFEETGLNIAGKTGEPIYSYENVDLERGDNYFVDIYHVSMAFNESDVRIRDREALGFALVGWDDIVELSKSGKFLHYERLCQALGKSI